MSLVMVDPPPEIWHPWRDKGLGGSDAARVAGVSPYEDQNRVMLWLEKSQQVKRENIDSPPLMWGHLLEEPIAIRVSQRLGVKYAYSQPCFQSDDRPWQLATLDRLTTYGEIVELKSVNYRKASELGLDGEVDTLPTSWIVQAQHQMAVTGFQVVIFGVFIGTTEDIRLYHVERNDELIDSLNEVEAEFWESVQTKTPPLALDVRDSEALVKHLGVQEGRIVLDEDVAFVVDEYNEVKRQIGLLEAMKDQSKAKIIDALCGVSSGVLPDGRIVKCSVSEIPGRTSVVGPHRRINLSFRNPKR